MYIPIKIGTYPNRLKRMSGKQRGIFMDSWDTKLLDRRCGVTGSLFSSNRSLWVTKNTIFYADSKFSFEIERSAQKKIYLKKLTKTQFLNNNFIFLHFCLRIWNQRKILRFLKKVQLYFLKNIKWSILLNAVVLSRCMQYIHAQRCWEVVGCKFSSKMPRTVSNLPDFPRCPFLYAHLSLLYFIYGVHKPIMAKCIKFLNCQYEYRDI